jgi:hypothetical protein
MGHRVCSGGGAQALTFAFVEAGGVSVAGVAERQVQILG